MRLGGLESDVARHFEILSTRGKVMVEYMWVGGTGGDLHSKTRILNFRPESIDDLPTTYFDGSLTGQADTKSCAVYLKPRKMCPDPFRGGDHLLVLCETFSPTSFEHRGSDMRPHPSNHRAPCEAVMQQAASVDPVFSIEQQYTLLDSSTSWPIGWPERASMHSMPSSYCGVGSENSFGRDFAECHAQACMHAGIPITGYSGEEVRAQWMYKIGPSRGVEISDQLWISRYILLRCSEKFKVKASLQPKPVPGDWNGNGAFVRYSTAQTRHGPSGFSEIQRHIQLLESAHIKHLMVYGDGNTERIANAFHKMFSPLNFTWGLENRVMSVRIPNKTFCAQKGYYEDRRPAANMDPYLVTMMLVCTTIGIELPNADSHFEEFSDETGSEASRGSSAILSELDRQCSAFAPDTPPQNISLLDSEYSMCR